MELSAATAVTLEAGAEEDAYYPFQGKIFAVNEDVLDEGEPVGSIDGWGVLSSLVETEEIGLVMNQKGQEFADAFDALNAAGLVEHTVEDLIVVHDVFLKPAHRGQDISLLAVRAALRIMGSRCQFAILDVRPHDYDEADDDAARAKLEAHFARLGAQRLPTPGFMLFDLWRRNDELDSGAFLPKGTPVKRFDLDQWQSGWAARRSEMRGPATSAFFMPRPLLPLRTR